MTFDDFDFGCKDQIELFFKLSSIYKNFKTTLFTIPKYNGGIGVTNEDMVNKPDWMEIAQHGLYHSKKEFQGLTKEEAKTRIHDGYFNGMVKGFKAPQWSYNLGNGNNTFEVLKELGYWVAVLPNQVSQLVKGIRYFSIHPTISDEFYFQGHIGNIGGAGIEENWKKLISFPKDSEFLFASELIRIY